MLSPLFGAHGDVSLDALHDVASMGGINDPSSSQYLAGGGGGAASSIAFKCPICFKGLSSSWHVTRHMRTHTGEKPFLCTVCDLRFSVKNNLKRHMISKHGHEIATIDTDSLSLQSMN